MNARLKKLPDSSGRNSPCWFDVVTTAGTKSDFGEIHWPFAVHVQVTELMTDDVFSVTHLPSGKAVMNRLSYRVAMKLVRLLRAADVNWNAEKPSKAAVEAARRIVLRLRRYQK